MPKRPEPADTATRILDLAEELVQTRGFSGFSYADIAARLDVTPASLHYHYASKADLGEALIRRYRTRFMSALDAVERQSGQAPAMLDSYARIYADVLRLKRMCLCGMLAAGYETLPDAMRREVVQFFDENETWLVRVLEQGLTDGTITFSGPASVVAQSIISGLEGALLIARPYDDVARFERAANRLLGSVTQTSPPDGVADGERARAPARRS